MVLILAYWLSLVNSSIFKQLMVNAKMVKDQFSIHGTSLSTVMKMILNQLVFRPIQLKHADHVVRENIKKVMEIVPFVKKALTSQLTIIVIINK